MFNVDESVPEKVREFDMVNVLEVVPPAMENPVALDVKASPLTVVKLGVAEVARVIEPEALVTDMLLPWVRVARV